MVILLGLSVFAGCVTTDEQRFPLDYVVGRRAAMQPGTAPEAFRAYQRMGAELERQGRFDDLLGSRVSLSKGRCAGLIAEEKALQERIALTELAAEQFDEAEFLSTRTP